MSTPRDSRPCKCKEPKPPKPGQDKNFCYRCKGLVGSYPYTSGSKPSTTGYGQPTGYPQSSGHGKSSEHGKPSGSAHSSGSGRPFQYQQPSDFAQSTEYARPSGHAQSSAYEPPSGYVPQPPAPMTEEEAAVTPGERASYERGLAEHKEQLESVERELKWWKPQYLASAPERGPKCRCLRIAKEVVDGVRLCWAPNGECLGKRASAVPGLCENCTNCDAYREIYQGHLDKRRSLLKNPPEPSLVCYCKKLHLKGKRGICFSRQVDGEVMCRSGNKVTNYYCSPCTTANCREKRREEEAQEAAAKEAAAKARKS
ncbi:hypothetical protein QBC40DRAFT_293662 [Triangularia verruculosa]|uniref:Uncharacterized protein n=1 Tax=Triangularia verruculosa TaxID=2587418 RepID=A0AAN6XMU0_9PEZI|nr:hypothetical protein QBC40DRAFT_293662 [Triangularia verruculosa]